MGHLRETRYSSAKTEAISFESNLEGQVSLETTWPRRNCHSSPGGESRERRYSTLSLKFVTSGVNWKHSNSY